MSNFTNEDVVTALGNMSVLEVIALTKKLETQWGVKAEPGPMQLGTLPNVEQKSDQEEFDVVLTLVPTDKKINIIKVVREMTGLGLKESKELVEAAPRTVRAGVSKADAEDFKSRLSQVGAEVEVK